MKNSTNIEKFECIEYIRDKIILITKFENLNIYFKTKVVDGTHGWIFFMMYDIDIHQLNLWKFRNSKFLDGPLFRKCVFLHLFNNECIVMPYFKEKTITISKKRRFYRWALHYFFKFFLFGNVSWIINMRPYGRWKIVSYIFYVHWFYPILLI